MTHFYDARLLTKGLTWLCLLSLPWSLSGCILELLQASSDGITDSFKGPSYGGYDSRLLIGVNAGVFFASGSGRAGGQSLRPSAPSMLLASTTPLPGLTAPPDTDSFLSHVSFLYGPQLITKGGKYSDGFGTTTSRRTYLEGIGYALYTYDLPDGRGRVFGGLGPYLGAGLWGTTKYEQPNFGTQSSGAFDTKNGGYSRFDAGLIFTAGYQLPQGLRLSIAHELGLTNIDPSGGVDKTRTRAWSLNVAYPAKKLIGKFRKK